MLQLPTFLNMNLLFLDTFHVLPIKVSNDIQCEQMLDFIRGTFQLKL